MNLWIFIAHLIFVLKHFYLIMFVFFSSWKDLKITKYNSFLFWKSLCNFKYVSSPLAKRWRFSLYINAFAIKRFFKNVLWGRDRYCTFHCPRSESYYCNSLLNCSIFLRKFANKASKQHHITNSQGLYALRITLVNLFLVVFITTPK